MSTKSVLGGLSGYVTVLGGVYKKCLGGVGWLCHCPKGCLQKVSWGGGGGLSGYVTVLGGVYKKCLGGGGGLSGYVTILGGVYKKCLGG